MKRLGRLALAVFVAFLMAGIALSICITVTSGTPESKAILFGNFWPFFLGAWALLIGPAYVMQDSQEVPW